jgi:hypothetical protein
MEETVASEAPGEEGSEVDGPLSEPPGSSLNSDGADYGKSDKEGNSHAVGKNDDYNAVSQNGGSPNLKEDRPVHNGKSARVVAAEVGRSGTTRNGYGERLLRKREIKLEQQEDLEQHSSSG